MNRDDELLLRRWLQARDPGVVRPELREAVASVPLTHRPARFPAFDLTRRSGFGVAPIARPLLIGLAILITIAAIAGALVLQPWRPFPPKGLLAYRAPATAVGATGITLVSADGSVRRQVGGAAPNVNDHSPRWSRDGETLLFARTTNLDSLNSCGGVGSVVLYDVATRAERVVATGLRPINVIDWSPSGNLAAYTYPPPGCGAQVELGVVDMRTGQVSTSVVLPQDSESDPSQGVKWHVEWSGERPVARPDAVITSNGPDFTTTVTVRSHAGAFEARYVDKTPDRLPTLEVVDQGTGNRLDLGRGGQPAWSPDDTVLAYWQPGGSAGPDQIDFVRDRLVLVTVATGARRTLADILMPDGIGPDLLPSLAWTSDGEAVYWVDITGTHVIDVVTGRSADISAVPEVCDELQWQPAGN
jgi:dipeptidyl aminopeptidase/acylaminoacyl peptidase